MFDSRGGQEGISPSGAEAMKRARAVTSRMSGADETLDLWRGMAQMDVGVGWWRGKAGSDFFRRGGTELAPMSTTTKLEVAVEYSGAARAGA